MLKNILYVLVTGTCCQALAWAIGVSGFVLNDNLEPLPYATVTHPKTGSWVIADEEGRFLLQTAVEPYDSLVFYRYGYREKTLVTAGAKQLKISLQRDAIPMDVVEVKGQAIPGNTPWETVIVTETDQMSSLGVVQRIPGTLLKTYGGRAPRTDKQIYRKYRLYSFNRCFNHVILALTMVPDPWMVSFTSVHGSIGLLLM